MMKNKKWMPKKLVVHMNTFVDDFLDEINVYSVVMYFKIIWSNDEYPVEYLIHNLINYFVKFKNRKEKERKIFYSVFVDCYDENVSNLTVLKYDSSKEIVLATFEHGVAYEMLILFNGKYS